MIQNFTSSNIKLILTIGIPGAGKSTWVSQYVKENPHVKVVSTDMIRKELTGTAQCDPKQNQMMHEEARKRTKRYLSIGYDVVVDSTNVDLEEWLEYKRLFPCIFIAKVFDITPDEAMKRQMNRERQVPLTVVQQKWNSFQKNKDKLTHIFDIII